jgi:hemerythrin
MIITLTKDLETGINRIDDQHRELINIINQLSEMATKGIDKDIIEQTLENLGAYIGKHFGDEEELQKKCNYPNYDAHKTQHDDFVKEYLHLKSEFNDKSCEHIDFTLKLLKFIVQWLVKHIKGSDVAMGKYCVEYLLKQSNK